MDPASLVHPRLLQCQAGTGWALGIQCAAFHRTIDHAIMGLGLHDGVFFGACDR